MLIFFMRTKIFLHRGHHILAGFIHHHHLSEWFKSLKHLSTSIVIDVLNFLPRNKKATRQTILMSLKNQLLCRWKWLMSLSISIGQELWFLCRWMQIKVLAEGGGGLFPVVSWSSLSLPGGEADLFPLVS
jgi:hypothetical protein